MVHQPREERLVDATLGAVIVVERDGLGAPRGILWGEQGIKMDQGFVDASLSIFFGMDLFFILSGFLDAGQTIHTLETGKAARSVSLTADGHWGISTSWDKAPSVWDLHAGQFIRKLEGHTLEVTDVSVTADGHWAVSASFDKTLKVWDLLTGRLLHTLEGHAGGVQHVAVTADGRRAISSSLDKTLKVWDLSTGRIHGDLEGHASEVGHVAVTADGLRVISTSQGRTLKIWDMESAQVLREFELREPQVQVAVTGDGRWAVLPSGDTLQVWDLGKGGATRTRKGPTEAITIPLLPAVLLCLP